MKRSDTRGKGPEPQREYRVIECDPTGGKTIVGRFFIEKEALILCGQLKRKRTQQQIRKGYDYFVELNDLS